MTWVFCVGMIRSGSTLQFQLASSIVEHSRMGQRVKYAPESEFETLLHQHIKYHGLKVFKAHICTPPLAKVAREDSTKVIYCYRDIRDVAVSAMRKFDFSFDALINAGWLDQAIADYRSWTTMPNVLVSRYEEIIRDRRIEASRIASFLDLSIEPDVLTALAEEYDIPSQQQRIYALKQRSGQAIKGSDIFFDEVELLHHNHIHKGEVDGWRHILSAQQQSFLTQRYRQWLSSMKYDFE
jgi:hypothetical protein